MLKRQAFTNPDQIFGKCPTSVDLAAVFHKEKPRKRRYSQVCPRACLLSVLKRSERLMVEYEHAFAEDVFWCVGGRSAASRGRGGVSRCEKSHSPRSSMSLSFVFIHDLGTLYCMSRLVRPLTHAAGYGIFQSEEVTKAAKQGGGHGGRASDAHAHKRRKSNDEIESKSRMSKGFATGAREQTISCDFLSPTRPSERDDEMSCSSFVPTNMGSNGAGVTIRRRNRCDDGEKKPCLALV